MSPPRVILILGPTASGKSALAMSLAKLLDGRSEIVSADSMQIYRGMDIGTAKPTAEDRARVPHHLIDIADPYADGFSVESWRGEATRTIEAVNSSGATAIVVGGTNLYVQALLSGLFEGPPANEALRNELRALAPEDLRARLTRHDPESAARIHVNDTRRAIRAIEVAETSGTPMSALQTQWAAGPPPLPDGWRCVGRLPDAPSNAAAINARVKAMMERGFLDEVRRLSAAGPLGRQAKHALGYEELAQHLCGQATLEGAVEATKSRTRRLARMQRTWLKRFTQIPGSTWSREPRQEFSGDFFAESLGRREWAHPPSEGG